MVDKNELADKSPALQWYLKRAQLLYVQPCSGRFISYIKAQYSMAEDSDEPFAPVALLQVSRTHINTLDIESSDKYIVIISCTIGCALCSRNCLFLHLLCSDQCFHKTVS